ncbi:serine-threonine protein kinase, putative [Entamoeba invadens IP1]|uniref:Serine-threonine protein kinase, putative n=1 Tax=Entamoeba invadens IP1 TaxID=370355 RepID=A0A0A1UDA7_ENTIV|nr:serine-threonine protein kinase, putative [Entamoeba invadens IP1]ELP94429.1 serine-threonine protein kinase, putative [Entamoeba invadens IP1]|eukprot:XP_004261200.1 serine-threonine protein kinase, putative [Entamoeba invadens IP1]
MSVVKAKSNKTKRMKFLVFGRLFEPRIADTPENTMQTTTPRITHNDPSTPLSTPDVSQIPQGNTFHEIPYILEYAFKYNETILETSQQPDKPLSLFNTEETVNWLKTFASESVWKRVQKKKLCGNELLSWARIKLAKCCESKEVAKNIIKKIKAYDNTSSFGLVALEKWNFTDEQLRDMYELEKGFTDQTVVQMKKYDVHHAIKVTFMAISIYFAQRDPIFTEGDIKIIKERNGEDALDRLDLTRENKCLVKRMFLFLKRMLHSNNSVFQYFKTNLEEFVISCLAPNLPIEPFKEIYNSITEEELSPYYFESENIYAGEVVLQTYMDIISPTYLIPILERVETIEESRWDVGVLYVTNYRILWRSTTKEDKEERSNFEMLYHVPIAMIINPTSGIKHTLCMRGDEEYYLVRILATSAHTLTFGFRSEDMVKSFLGSIDEVQKKNVLIDKYDIFIDYCPLQSVAERMFERLKNKDGLVVNDLSDPKGMKECGIVMKDFNINYHQDELFEKSENFENFEKMLKIEKNGKVEKLEKNGYGVILVGESDKNGRVYRLQVTGDFKWFDRKYFERKNINIVDFECSTDEITTARIEKLYEDVRGYKTGMEETLFTFTELVNQELKKVFACFYDIIKRYTYGSTFLFLSNTYDNVYVCFVSCLFLVLTDKYYRSFDGFIELLHVHVFASHALRTMLNAKRCIYPLFLFLHGMECLLQSYPSMFQFKNELLYFLMYHTLSKRFSTMSTDENPSQSLYCFLLPRKRIFINKDFENFDFNFIDYFKTSLVLLEHSFFVHFTNYTIDKRPLFNKALYQRQAVDFSRLNLIILPRYFFNCLDNVQTRRLTLSETYLKFIPTQIALLPNLESLVFASNDLQFIPQWHLNHMTALTYLDISENKQMSSRYEMIRFDLLTNLKMLNITNRQVNVETAFPDSINTIIARNSFQAMPKMIYSLPNLVSLDLSSNVSLCSSSIFTVTRLNALTISHCNKTDIPNSIGQMTNLTELNISENHISKLPFSLYSLVKLVKLDISSNDVRFISSLLSKLTNLTCLMLQKNPNGEQNQTCINDLLKKLIVQHYPYEIQLHILSDKYGTDEFRRIYDETKKPKSDSYRLVEQGVIAGDAPKDQLLFRVSYHEYESRFGFFTPNGDCYLLVLFRDNWNLVLEQWKYHLLHTAFTNKNNTGDLKLQFVLFWDDKKSTEAEDRVKEIKKRMEPFFCLGTVAYLKEKKKNDLRQKVRKIFEAYTQSVYADSFMKIMMEVKMSSFNPPVLKQGLLFKMLHDFEIDDFNTLLNLLHRYGVVLSVTQSLEGLKMNDQILHKKGTFVPNSDASANMVVADPDFIRKIYEMLMDSSKDGFGFLEDISTKLSDYFLNLEVLNGVMLYVEMFYDVFIARDDLLNAFGLQEKYLQFAKTKISSRTDFFDVLQNDRRDKNYMQRCASTMLENPFYFWESGGCTVANCKTPSAAMTKHNSKTLYFQPRNIKPLLKEQIEKVWPSQHDVKEMDFGRKINAKFFPPLFYSTFVFYASVEGMNIVKVTKNQCFLSKVVEDQHYYFYILYSDTEFIIRTRYRATTVKSVFIGGKLMGELTDIFANIQKVLFPNLKSEEFILCPKCLICGNDELSCVLPKRTLINAIEKNQDKVCFEKGHECLVSTCALDLVLSEIKNSKRMQIDIIDLESDLDSATQDKVLGLGSTAKVFLTKVKNQNVAVKLFSLDPSSFSTVRGEGCAAHSVSKGIVEMRREVNVMKMMTSPYILGLTGISFEPLALIMDYCDLGNLYDFLANPKNEVTWEDRVEFAYEVASGMTELHAAKLIHRDLKSPNILLKTEGGRVKCLISDFGTSGVQLFEENVFVDNPKWVAPEVMRGFPFEMKSDVYSFGIIMWELVERKEPFGDARFPSQLKQLIIKGLRPSWSEEKHIHPEYFALVESCWADETSKRPPFEEATKTLQKLKSEVAKDLLPIQ